MVPLSAREAQIFNIYRDAILSKTKIPTLREISAMLDISYTAANTYTNRIIDKGYLIRTTMILAPDVEV